MEFVTGENVAVSVHGSGAEKFEEMKEMKVSKCK